MARFTGGWVPQHRDRYDDDRERNPFYGDALLRDLYATLMSWAVREDTYMVKRGQCLTSITALAEWQGSTRDVVRKRLARLVALGLVLVVDNAKTPQTEPQRGITVTILKYDEITAVAQREPQTEPQQSHSRATDEPQQSHSRATHIGQDNNSTRGQGDKGSSSSGGKPARRPRKDPAPPGMDTKSGPTWAAYSAAMQERHRGAPLWNAQAGGLISQLIAKVGEDMAPKVAEFYVWHNDAQYLKNRHPLTFAVRDAQRLVIDMQTGFQSTSAAAREAERLTHNRQSGQIALQILEEKSGKQGGFF